jgi:ribosomal protein S18 acetylase RimI-like enzyme
MTHENLVNGAFSDSPPKLCHYSHYKPGDELAWSRLQATTDSFENENLALAYFQKEFDSAVDELEKRCFFLKTDQQQIIGSAMAWYGDTRFDRSYGRLHWVVIHPDFRRKGLGKHLITFTMHQLSLQYSNAYLTTQTTSFPAINIYLDLGFRPFIAQSTDETAWQLLKELLKHPALL